ncbi:hypothetical protein [Desulfolutivibrio sp.]|uniref:hypothetical protein n=1 Tax=Desulfolutivibrio sp. TaxID=2773296 RepID=UPI002F96A15A
MRETPCSIGRFINAGLPTGAMASMASFTYYNPKGIPMEKNPVSFHPPIVVRRIRHRLANRGHGQHGRLHMREAERQADGKQLLFFSIPR